MPTISAWVRIQMVSVYWYWRWHLKMEYESSTACLIGFALSTFQSTNNDNNNTFDYVMNCWRIFVHKTTKVFVLKWTISDGWYISWIHKSQYLIPSAFVRLQFEICYELSIFLFPKISLSSGEYENYQYIFQTKKWIKYFF